MRILILPAILGLLLLLLLALFSVPARIIPGFIDEQQLRLSGVSGRAVDGRAARALLRTPSGFFHLGELRWRLDPWSLLTLSPALHLESEWSTQRGSLRVRLAGSQLQVRDLDAVVDAAVIQQALPISVSGRLELLFDELVLEEQQLISAQGRLVWQDAAWQPASGPRNLGTYVAEITSPGDGELEAQLDTLSGSVQAQGSVVLVGQRFSTDVRVAAASGALDAELAQALSLIATPEENGYRLRLDGGVGSGQ
jgi:hypothetical protein